MPEPAAAGTVAEPDTDPADLESRSSLRADNFKLREQKRALRDELAVVKKQIPPEGAVVLIGEDAKTWNEVKALGKTPAEIKATLEKMPTLETENTNLKRERVADDAAQELKWHPRVLRKLVQTENLHLEVKDVTETVNGQTLTKRVPHVRPQADAKAELKPLADYVNQNLKDFLPSLTATEGTTSGNGAAHGASSARYPEQRNTEGRAASGDTVAQFLATREERNKAIKNPLAPRA